MALPKRRHSKARTRTRRSTKVTAMRTIGRCSQCGEPKLSHRVCPNCGAYAGRSVTADAQEATS